VIEVEGLDVLIGERGLLHGATFALERGEHVALVGPNGSGKTTLLETMLGRRDAAGGKLRLGHGVVPAYFSQHEAELDERGSVLDAAMAGTGLKRPEAQSLLGRFLFSGWDEHEKPVVALSGGERRRLALAIVVASGANFLVLDEPTNHLDLESRESLEAALEAFPGTVLVVSHDRALLDAVADRLLAVEGRAIASYPGGWADYVRAQEAQDAPPAPAPKAPRPERPRRPAKPRPSALDEVEAEVEKAEARLADVEQKLAADWSDVELVAAHKRARDELDALLRRWESLFQGSGSTPR
jgi:ATP-binding cassette subfamily F protein 3